MNTYEEASLHKHWKAYAKCAVAACRQNNMDISEGNAHRHHGTSRLLLKWKENKNISDMLLGVQKWRTAGFGWPAKVRSGSCYRHGLGARLRNRNHTRSGYIFVWQQGPSDRCHAFRYAHLRGAWVTWHNAMGGSFTQSLALLWHLCSQLRKPQAIFLKWAFPHIIGDQNEIAELMLEEL